MTRTAWLSAALVAAAAVAVVVMTGSAARVPSGFPHQAHERLFPVCEACHAGVLRDDSVSSFPRPSQCARCHDGTRVGRVDWQERVPRPSLLRFSHERHQSAVPADSSPRCQKCHAEGGAAAAMAVGAAAPERCIACHEHRAAAHLDNVAQCSRCHLAVGAAAGLSSARIARFPRPDWHALPDFLSTHATTAAPADASCAVCHARETCERCHANAAALPRVQALPRDARVAAIEAGRTPAYPIPQSHADAAWRTAHGRSARTGIEGCANCHTQPSCTGCHMSEAAGAGAAVRRLPPLVPDAAPGVDPSAMSTVHDARIRTDHGRQAASGQLACEQCHAREQCAECHAAADSRAFHPVNFLERHAVEVYAGRGECRSCHTTETFCRSCHARMGVGAQNMKASFHDGQSNWLLSHGRAARTGLDSCASCHRQNDCIQCHSAAGGWGVNPHGPGFTGSAAARSSASCRLCHRTAPPGSGP